MTTNLSDAVFSPPAAVLGLETESSNDNALFVTTCTGLNHVLCQMDCRLLDRYYHYPHEMA